MVDPPLVVTGGRRGAHWTEAGAHVTAPLTAPVDEARCLNCGAPLHGAFCAACGQRAVPADPTVADVAGDAWQELSGYDGRIAATFRALMRPGLLTLEYLQGRRKKYLSPMRLYLTVSVVYFLIAAAAPQIAGGLRIGFTNTASSNPQVLTESERRELLQGLGDMPWMLRPTIRQMAEDPDGFRARIFATLPRVFFAMVPAFAGMVALFYRNRNFPTALVFTAHVHAFAFVIFSVSEAAKFTYSETAATILGLIAATVFTLYLPKALIVVFGGSWWATIWKTTVMGFLYLLISLPAFFIVLIVSTLV